MTEKDYEDILRYILDRLTEIGATEVIDYVKEMKKVNITVKANTDKPLKTDQFNIDTEKFPGDPKLASTKKLKKDQNGADLSQGVSRQMTYQEILLSLIAMMKTCVTSVPDLVNATKNLLGDAPIVWKEERGKDEDLAEPKISLEEINVIATEERKLLEELLDDLKIDVEEEEAES